MLEIILFIAVPTLFVLVGAVAALSFARDTEEIEATTNQKTVEAPVELFRPRTQVGIKLEKELAYEELIASLEAYIRTEREAANAFITRPSAEALWVN